MKVWLITVGEPLPTDKGKNRLLRTGLLANALVEKRHDVTWWTSTFDHWRKVHRSDPDTVLKVGSRLQIVLLRGIGYRKNVSVSRLVDHALVGLRFSRMAKKYPRPDVILCSLPTLELSLAAVRYGRHRNIPVVLDVRDLWPDLFVELAPPRWRALAKLAFAPMFQAARVACRGATAIIGNSPGHVEWGLRHAGRGGGPWDRVFPFGYSQQRPDDESIHQARRFWGKYGLADKPEKCFVVCFFGTISRQFDLATVIAAARRLEERGRDFKFVLCGTGGALDDYKKLAGDCASVVFPGWVPLPEIWTLMQVSDVGIAPYQDGGVHQHNLPNKPIEYMSAGLPIVSSLSGYLQELLSVNDCGVTYRHGDADSLAHTLNDLYENEARVRAMSRNSSELYKRKFVAEQIYRDMSEYLEAVCRP
jgi:glycosyltransferase involved in cell wall biosynthesis